jgi:simple sugar transport system substrate-binding protein
LTGGFDINSHIIRNLKEGKTIATVDQQAYLQGFYTVVQLYLANMGLVPLDMDTGSAVIDKTNVDLVDPRLVP